jgi:acetate kinase
VVAAVDIKRLAGDQPCGIMGKKGGGNAHIGFVFTAGIGENSPGMCARIVERLAWLGGTLDEKANAAGASRISAAGSRLAIHVVPTDEELMIARHTVALLSARGGC